MGENMNTPVFAEMENLVVDIAFVIEIIALAIFSFVFRSRDKKIHQ
jgi:hypothetical protein